jgi:hypothetical protein
MGGVFPRLHAGAFVVETSLAWMGQGRNDPLKDLNGKNRDMINCFGKDHGKQLSCPYFKEMD